MLTDIETDSDSWDSYDESSIDVEECLFCGFVSSSLEDNVQHMSSHHGFFLPDAEFISNLDGLISYLGLYISFVIINFAIMYQINAEDGNISFKYRLFLEVAK